MKVVRARTGASALGIPHEGVIIVDPDLGHDTAVGAIRAVLPDAHPDAVRHWVEGVIPTAQPLGRHVRKKAAVRQRAAHRDRRLRAGSRALYQLAALAMAAVVGGYFVSYAHAGTPHSHTPAALDNVFVPPSPQVATATPRAAPQQAKPSPPSPAPQAPQPMQAASVWTNATFTELRDKRGWTCVISKHDALATDCTTKHGLKMHFEAWLGPGGVTHYTVSYKDGLWKHRVELKVFPDRPAMLKFLEGISRLNFPNLVAKENWMLYGSDLSRILIAAKAIETGDSPQSIPSSREEFRQGVNDFLNRMS